MQQIRLDSKEGIAGGWAGVGDARNLPDLKRSRGTVVKPGADAEEQPPRRGLASALLRFARNAAVGLLVLSSVPFGVVTWRAQHLSLQQWTDTRLKLEQVESVRALKSPVDASITPMEAGLAFGALQAPQKGAPPNKYLQNSTGVATRASYEQPMWPWRANKSEKELFKMRTGGFDGPSPQYAMSFAQEGFTPAEMAWLKELAEAPVWKDFDKVGSAKLVDLVGAHNQLSFRNDASAPMMPFIKYAGTKELAYAGVVRAAYYLANNEPARAEAALRSVISFGFALIDNGTNALDGLIGRVIVGVGRNAFEQFAVNGRNFPAGYDNTAWSNIKGQNFGARRGTPVSLDEMRQQLFKDISDPALPRTIRWEQLNKLSLTSCNSIPEVWSGPSQETRDAFAQASSALVRFPSEQAQLDLILDETNRIPESEVPHDIGRRLVVGAATVAATITNNPRLATCTKLSVGYW